VPVSLALPGKHNVYNALAAASIGRAFGLTGDEIRRGLETVRPASMRGVLHRLANGVEVLDDSYNSNPAAMEKALEALAAATPHGRRVLVSGDMLELGSYEGPAHARLGRRVARRGSTSSSPSGRCTGRPPAPPPRRGRPRCGISRTRRRPRPSSPPPRGPETSVLVKGSRGMKMERVVQALLGAAGGAPAGGAGGGH